MDPQPRIAVIAAMRQELQPFAARLSLRPRPGSIASLVGGYAGRAEVIAGITTMGTGPAAEFTDRVLRSYQVDHVIGIGIAGGIGPTVAIGDLVVPELVVDGESGVELRPVPIDGHRPRGTLMTSDALVSDKGAVLALESDGVIAVDMETSAIGAACERHGVPWSVLRAISDHARDIEIDEALVGLARPDGSADPAAVARFLLTRPRRIPHLVTLGRGMRAAAHRSSAAAARACTRY